MKKDDLIKILNEKHGWEIEELKCYTVEGLENALMNGKLIESMRRKNLKKNDKSYVPKTLKNKVWDEYIGKDKGIGNCYCCDKKIDSKHFETGHIIAKFNSGKTVLDNLRPICSCCNKSIGTKNMDDFKKKYMEVSNTKIDIEDDKINITNSDNSINKIPSVSSSIQNRRNRFSDLVQAQLTHDEKISSINDAIKNNKPTTLNILGITSNEDKMRNFYKNIYGLDIDTNNSSSNIFGIDN